jgi:hypothetical protein
LNPVGELGLDGEDHVLQLGKVTVMETAAAREFPNALDRIQFRAVGRQEIQREALGALLPPLSVKSSMVVLGIVRDHHHAPRRSGGDRLQRLEKLPAGNGIELTCLAPKEEPSVAQANGAKIANAVSAGVVVQDRVSDFGRHPHPAARTMLLEVHFVHGPKIHRGIGG